MKNPILEVLNLKKYFLMKRNPFLWKKPDLLRAVDNISFTIHQGETFGLVGESGCGKSTVAKMLLRILSPSSGMIRFMDQGPGIPEQYQDRIFDPFFSTKRGSSGMGLAISRRIINEHGGELLFEPREGGGSEFIIEMPLEEEHD